MREDRLIEGLTVGLLTAYAVTLLWMVPYLPMVDIPQHAAQVAIAHDYGNPRLPYRDVFEINLFTPYLVGYGLAYLLAFPFSVSVAVKLVITTAILGLPIATRRLLTVGGADPRWAIVAFPVAFGFAFSWGFLNFLVALPIGVWFLAEVLELSKSETRRSGARVALLGLMLFFSHIMLLAFCVGVGTLILALERGRAARPRSFLPLYAPVPLALIWLIRSPWSPESGTLAPQWAFGLDRLEGLLPLAFGLSGGLAVSLIVALFLAAPVVAGGRPSRSMVRWTPLALVVGLSLVGPSVMAGTAFVYQRFGVFLLPFYFFAFDGPTRRIRPSRRTVLPVLALLWLTVVGKGIVNFDAASEGFDSILAEVPPGRRLLYGDLARAAGIGVFVPGFMHFGAWYQVESGGVVDYSFAQLFPQPFRYAPGSGPSFSEAFPWQPDLFDWDQDDGDAYDFFLFRAMSRPPRSLFAGSPSPPVLLDNTGWWWLYGRSEPDQSRTARRGAESRNVADGDYPSPAEGEAR